MNNLTAGKPDKEGYNEYYKGLIVEPEENKETYIEKFEQGLKPFFQGGSTTKGFVRGHATDLLLDAAEASGKPHHEIRILDAGSGLGRLSVYLACKGYNVVGVDISEQGCAAAQQLAAGMGVADHCSFQAESLEDISLNDSSIDFVIGHGSLHHFIKYDGVPSELWRMMKPGGQGFFADSFGENPFYQLFHDKKKMERLGDVSLTRKLILDYFEGFEVDLEPTDWFVMLDKLYLKVLPATKKSMIRKLSKAHFRLDRRIPATSRLALALSGSVITKIRKV